MGEVVPFRRKQPETTTAEMMVLEGIVASQLRAERKERLIYESSLGFIDFGLVDVPDAG
jgi:hypothetical protein